MSLSPHRLPLNYYQQSLKNEQKKNNHKFKVMTNLVNSLLDTKDFKSFLRNIYANSPAQSSLLVEFLKKTITVEQLNREWWFQTTPCIEDGFLDDTRPRDYEKFISETAVHLQDSLTKSSDRSGKSDFNHWSEKQLEELTAEKEKIDKDLAKIEAHIGSVKKSPIAQAKEFIEQRVEAAKDKRKKSIEQILAVRPKNKASLWYDTLEAEHNLFQSNVLKKEIDDVKQRLLTAPASVSKGLILSAEVAIEKYNLIRHYEQQMNLLLKEEKDPAQAEVKINNLVKECQYPEKYIDPILAKLSGNNGAISKVEACVNKYASDSVSAYEREKHGIAVQVLKQLNAVSQMLQGNIKDIKHAAISQVMAELDALSARLIQTAKGSSWFFKRHKGGELAKLMTGEGVIATLRLQLQNLKQELAIKEGITTQQIAQGARPGIVRVISSSHTAVRFGKL